MLHDHSRLIFRTNTNSAPLRPDNPFKMSDDVFFLSFTAFTLKKAKRISKASQSIKN